MAQPAFIVHQMGLCDWPLFSDCPACCMNAESNGITSSLNSLVAIMCQPSTLDNIAQVQVLALRVTR